MPAEVPVSFLLIFRCEKRMPTWPKQPTPAPKILRVVAACTYLGIGRSTLYLAIKNCELQPIKIGRGAVGFTIESLDAFIALRIAATPQTVKPVRIAAPELDAGVTVSTR